MSYKMIDLDTAIMEMAVQHMVDACNEVDRAVAAIQAVKQHNDWQCKERDRINENNQQARKNIIKLRDCTYSFSNALKDAVNDFKNQENSVNQSINEVAGDIGAILNVVNDPILPQPTINILQRFMPKVFPKIHWYIFDRAQTIDICSFPNLK